MGMVFGKQTVAEPAFTSLLNRTMAADVKTTYEIRQYGQRFAAEVAFAEFDDNNGGGNQREVVVSDNEDDRGSPFRALAQYIGVFGDAQNDGGKSIAMTAPVVIEGDDDEKDTNVGGGGGTKIAMTAPVVITSSESAKQQQQQQEGGKNHMKTMKFILPAEYDEMSKIPKPTNPNVHIVSIPPQVGAVHRYNGDRDDKHNMEIVRNLAEQLSADGIEGMTTDFALQHYQFWGFNPPFTIPYFRRNEIWLELTSEQANALVTKYGQRQEQTVQEEEKKE